MTAGFDYNNLTRDQAIELTSADTVDKLDAENCEYRGGDDYQEWTAGVVIEGVDVLEAHYYQPKSAFTKADGEEVEDLSDLDWKIDHYSLT